MKQAQKEKVATQEQPNREVKLKIINRFNDESKTKGMRVFLNDLDITEIVCGFKISSDEGNPPKAEITFCLSNVEMDTEFPFVGRIPNITKACENCDNEETELKSTNRHSYANSTILSFAKEVKEVRFKKHVSMLLATGSWIVIGYCNHKTILIRIQKDKE